MHHYFPYVFSRTKQEQVNQTNGDLTKKIKAEMRNQRQQKN